MPRVRLDTADHGGSSTRDDGPRGMRINTDVFTLLSSDRMGGGREIIDQWLDCWSGTGRD